MSDNTINRLDLLKLALLVRPALSKQDYIPALQHIAFDGKYATAYNDISAIAVRIDMDVKRCLPGELLIRALQSFGAAEVLFQQKETEAILSSGRSKLKLPTLDTADFPLRWPEEDGQELALHPDIVRGIERCLMSVGNDPTHPEAMGVTLDSVGGCARLFSTDAFSISSYETGRKLKLPGEAPVILPTFFCEQLVALGKAYGEEELFLIIHPGAIVAEFGKKARLLTKTLVDREPLDFPAMMAKNLKIENLKAELVQIPASFDAALGRALLVLEGETDKVTQVKLGKDSFSLHSSSSRGDSDDKLPFDGDIDFGAPEEIYFDPAIAVRGAKPCAFMGFLPKALVLADAEAQFVHLVAYCSK